jgi:SAM-dependent methyltransferase
MSRSDEQNIELAVSSDSVDETNGRFYGAFTFPWRPMKFDRTFDPGFEADMLNQNIGDWSHKIVPKSGEIWVAGCGANQALITACKFPEGFVVGSDLSAESLDFCAEAARKVAASNLELRRESLNCVAYREQFDYVICTGVIHHNAEPRRSLARLARALKPSGILELMVYNRYHRITTSAFQKAVRLLRGEDRAATDFAGELSFAKRLIDGFRAGNSVSHLLSECQTMPDAAIADTLIQPVEHSYTVESLREMAASCGLELLLPCVNAFDRAWKTISWDLEFGDEELQRTYDALEDCDRWQVTNLLLAEKSPMLWFYFQRMDSGRTRKTERQVCDEFLVTKFVRTNERRLSYVLADDGDYRPAREALPHPRAEAGASVKRIVELCDGRHPIGEIFRELNLQTTFRAVNQARLLLTTSAFPYLKAATAKSPALPATGRSIKGARRALGRVSDGVAGVYGERLMERG